MKQQEGRRTAGPSCIGAQLAFPPETVSRVVTLAKDIEMAILRSGLCWAPWGARSKARWYVISACRTFSSDSPLPTREPGTPRGGEWLKAQRPSPVSRFELDSALGEPSDAEVWSGIIVGDALPQPSCF